MKVLITGGAGYIGSHAAHALIKSGYKVVVVDDLSQGHKELLPLEAEFYRCDIGNIAEIRGVFKKTQVDQILHFAGLVSVSDSVTDPLSYYQTNFSKAANFLSVALDCGVTQFVFSSTAAVYGTPKEIPVKETSALNPESPYGASKLMFERLLQDVAKSSKLKFVILRYFNVAGAHSSGEIGQISDSATHLIKRAVEAGCGKRNSIEVYGTDYPTKDGTGVRDYIHVEDLAEAHVLALKYLKSGGESDIFNCGYGSGYSVKEVLAMVEKVSGEKLNIVNSARRDGDIASIIADSSKIISKLGWRPRFTALSDICKSSFAWEKKCLSRK